MKIKQLFTIYLSLFFEGIRQIAVGIWEMWLQIYGFSVGIYSKIYQSEKGKYCWMLGTKN